MLCNKKDRCASDIVYMILMTIPFMFLPFRIMFYVPMSTAAVYVMTAALSIWCVADTVKDLIKFIKTAHKS